MIIFDSHICPTCVWRVAFSFYAVTVPWALRGHAAEMNTLHLIKIRKENGDHMGLCALGLGAVYLSSTYNPQASTHLHSDT